jgi:cellulose synthase/poly-beta-1,6-N-acetylglucosamine synthase-like glycosyltransferase
MSCVGLVAAVLFWSNVILIAYIYWGYGALLNLLVRFRTETPSRSGYEAGEWPFVTILLTVHNEERNVAQRLANLMELDYAPGRIEILVVSDGSTDRTDAIVDDFRGDRPVRLIRTARLGKSVAQNGAMREAKGDIVVLTDAEASFDPSCVRDLVAVFADAIVGCATAHLRLLEHSGAVAASQGMYWSYELKLRDLESRLGILAVASGSAMAFRRSLFDNLPAHVGDDCIIPLHIAEQGYRVVHCRSALASDVMEAEDTREFRSRIRMTARNWSGTWMAPSLLNPLRHPGYAFALWSHKLLRWLGSVGLVTMTVAALAMAATGIELQVVLAFGAFLAAGAMGLWASRRRKTIPVIGTVYSFLLANAGFLVGICKAMSGQSIVTYRSGMRSP